MECFEVYGDKPLKVDGLGVVFLLSHLNHAAEDMVVGAIWLVAAIMFLLVQLQLERRAMAAKGERDGPLVVVGYGVAQPLVDAVKLSWHAYVLA